MNDPLLQAVGARFAAFTAPYLAEPGDGFAYQLKVEHTARVVDLARRIAAAEAVADRVAQCAALAAQLHDLGRFPQYRQYRTFRDAVSANHAALSVRHSLRARMLEGVPAEFRRLVLGAVFLHNVRLLRPGLPAELDCVTRILRDSDKLDIFKVMLAHFSQTEPAHPEVALHVEMHPTAYTPGVLEDLRTRVAGDYSRVVYANDFKLMVAGWLYDMNFRSSCALLQERGYIPAIFDSLPAEPAILAVRAQVEQDLARRAQGA